MKSQVLHTVWCNISCEAAGEIWSLLGVRGLTYCFVNCLQGYYRRLDQLQDDFVSILEKAREVCRSDNEVGSREATFVNGSLWSTVNRYSTVQCASWLILEPWPTTFRVLYFMSGQNLPSYFPPYQSCYVLCFMLFVHFVHIDTTRVSVRYVRGELGLVTIRVTI